MASLLFTGYINGGDQEFGYLDFINTLREMAQGRTGNAEVHFSLNHEGFEEKTFSPKLKIDFGDNCYIHEFAPFDGENFGDFETVDDPNYPTYSRLPNKRTGTLINFWKKCTRYALIRGQYAY